MTETETAPVFNDRGQQTGGRRVAGWTDRAIAAFGAAEYARLKLARQEDHLLDLAAQVPAEDRDAYVAATDLIRERTEQDIAKITERRAAKVEAAASAAAGA